MNISHLRFVDKNLGRPLCFLLTLHRRFFDLFRKVDIENKKVDKILFIKLIEQGATVLAYPALKKAVDMVGKENVYFMVFKENRFILDILDVVPSSNVISINSENIREFALSFMWSIYKIRKLKIDASIDMEFFSRAPAIFSYLSGASRRVGVSNFTSDGSYIGNLFNYNFIYNPYIHVSQFYLNFVEALNHKSPGNRPMIFETQENTFELPRFRPSTDEIKLLSEKIEKLKGSKLGKPVVILNPNASDMLPIRKWKNNNFMILGNMILEDFSDATIIITGIPKEREIADKLVSQLGNAVSLAGRSSFRELLTLYCLSDVLVTNDSGPAHFSTLTPIKSVILFGPETPALYGPICANTEVISTKYVCSPCVNAFNHRNSPCEEGHCLNSITPERVYGVVKKLLLTMDDG